MQKVAPNKETVPVDTTNIETMTGSVEKILFQDLNSGFNILVINRVDRKESCVVTGNFPTVVCGHIVTITGRWTTHARFGKRFEAQTFYSTTPTSLKGLVTYLGSGLIKGVGPQLAERLVNAFGLDVLKIIDNNPELLNRISGLGEKRVEAIKIAWAEQKELAQLMMTLQEKGLSATYATKLYKTYREKTLTILRDNPYQLADDIWGIGFTLADEIAQKMGVHHTAPQRLNAGLRFCLKKAAQQGHLYMLYGTLIQEATTALALSAEQNILGLVIDDLCLQGTFVSIHHMQQRLIALPAAYKAERTVADGLLKLCSMPSLHQLTHDGIFDICHKQSASATLTEEQRTAIIAALMNKVSIITGGPGTGKTTILSVLLRILEHYKISYKLAAPTGRAAQRMSERTSVSATTIHRLLEFDFEAGIFKYNASHPLKTSVLIIDECSMIDIQLAQAIICALAPTTQLILIGDSDQLPPIGPGNFFRDLINSGTLPVLRLTQIFRQGINSLITHNAHRIREGLFPVTSLETSIQQTDYIFIPETDSSQIGKHLKKIIFVETPLRGCTSQDVMVLSPMHRGHAGTQQLNQFLQTLYNPDKKASFTYAGVTFKIKDRVMQLRNNYDKLTFNGDIGFIISIDTEDKIFIIDYEGRRATYLFDEAGEIMLAYASTIHKSQGSEFPIVVIPVFMEHFAMLRRNLIYTAITRAQKLCVVIGEKRALAIALRQIDNIKRFTLLPTMLQELSRS